MSISEKLTIQALKDHDKVHPTLKASPLKAGSKELSPKQYAGSKVSSRRSHPSGDASQKSERNGRPHPKINFFKLVVATRAWQRMAKTNSNARMAERKPPIRYENTYKTGPDEGKTFSQSKIEDIMKEVLEKRLKTVKYTAENCRLLTTEIAADIKLKVKTLEMPRYKLVCNVFITENKQQGIEIASRCLWNHTTDNFASYTYRNSTLIAMANVYGIYFE